MSLRLLLDEDSQAKPLVKLLRDAGHDVVTINEVGLTSQPDPVVLDYAKQTYRLLLTHNCHDFEILHRERSIHSGILVVYQNDDRAKNMSRRDIVAAIANLEAANVPLENQFISLNQWRY